MPAAIGGVASAVTALASQGVGWLVEKSLTRAFGMGSKSTITRNLEDTVESLLASIKTAGPAPASVAIAPTQEIERPSQPVLPEQLAESSKVVRLLESAHTLIVEWQNNTSHFATNSALARQQIQEAVSAVRLLGNTGGLAGAYSNHLAAVLDKMAVRCGEVESPEEVTELAGLVKLAGTAATKLAKMNQSGECPSCTAKTPETTTIGTAYDYQWTKLEPQVKRRDWPIATGADANIRFRLENAGDAFREIASPTRAEDYIADKLDRLEQSLVDSEWRAPLTAKGKELTDEYRALALAAPATTPRELAARELLVAVSERNLSGIRAAIQKARSFDTAPTSARVQYADRPTTAETIADLRERLTDELLQFQDDLVRSLKIAGKRCDCGTKHSQSLRAKSYELMSMDSNPVYQEIVQWVETNMSKLTAEASGSGQYDSWYSSEAVAQIRDFRKRVGGTP